jgi:hypothetical protein
MLVLSCAPGLLRLLRKKTTPAKTATRTPRGTIIMMAIKLPALRSIHESSARFVSPPSMTIMGGGATPMVSPGSREGGSSVRAGAPGSSILFFSRFRPNSPIVSQKQSQIFKVINRSGSITSSGGFGRSKKGYPFKKKNTAWEQGSVYYVL